MPPSTNRICPVISEFSGLTHHARIAAICSGRPGNAPRIGTIRPAVALRSGSDRMYEAAGVSTKPGATTFSRNSGAGPIRFARNSSTPTVERMLGAAVKIQRAFSRCESVSARRQLPQVRPYSNKLRPLEHRGVPSKLPRTPSRHAAQDSPPASGANLRASPPRRKNSTRPWSLPARRLRWRRSHRSSLQTGVSRPQPTSHVLRLSPGPQRHPHRGDRNR